MDKTKEYIERINKVIDYIELNLDGKIDLDNLAKLACFSKFHFHRIFLSFTDEPLYSFINRLRLERAAALLLTQEKTVTDIALSCGFNDSATFSRAFKKHFKVSAQQWKKKKNSKIHQDYQIKSQYTSVMDIKNQRIIEAVAVEEKQLQDTDIAYIRYTGSYAGDSKLFYSLHKKLINWRFPKGSYSIRQQRRSSSIMIQKGLRMKKTFEFQLELRLQMMCWSMARLENCAYRKADI